LLIDPYTVAKHLLRWIEEDAPLGDITTYSIIPENVKAKAHVVLKSKAVPSCTKLVGEALKLLGFKVEVPIVDGVWAKPGTIVMVLEGDARRILLFERTILNLLIYTYGVSTTTRMFIETVRGKVRIAATRKTPPGLRYYAKCAVAQAGGDTHRLSLSDAILIKDNHIAIAGPPSELVRRAKEHSSFTHKVEIEVSTLEDALAAAEAGVDIIMLDNMKPSEVRRVVEELERRGLRRKVVVEASGGITLENVVEYAETGVDVISTSVLTMNPVKVDLSLQIVRGD
jgi:nicotinate-nucleotide pyrophosphorylase (carboxylating)